MVIPTKGWVGIVENGETPIYLDSNDFMKESLMSLEESKIGTFSINMQTSPRLTQFYNVGNFDPVELTSINFSTEIRHDFQKGASACQYTYISFYTNEGIVMIPISQKGCVAKLNLINHDQILKGNENDLSGFGTDISRWTKVDVRNEREGIMVYLNGDWKYKIIRS
ncbi:Uncharacterised protein [Sphingobacterium mizutaii]|uniref:Uncharacterized protein n=3 Tax=Sphingobacterium mizutaii TaxID=1010 RepID=A0AAJ4XAH5_9SPHI|nr:hypothetical protein SAMN05192578_101376 [Sphingobacterium mizutaii]SNV48138.1 Uncharacterised protein [Sphingobacterium mizutaii]